MEMIVHYRQPHRPHTNQKPLVAERLAASHERMRFVDICMIPPCLNSGKGADFLTEICYNQASLKSETAVGASTPSAASNHQSKGTRPMANDLSYHLSTTESRDPQPDFPPRIIQRVDALSYMLPMIAPDGSRCMVTLTGDFAAWGACMTALVGAGFGYAEPSAWVKGGAS